MSTRTTFAADETAPQISRRARWRRFASALQTAAIVGALAALAAWGHSTGWQLPQFAALMGNSAAPVTDWCEEHNVPESQCIECNPTLVARGAGSGWCREHGIAPCPLCHPDVAELKTIPPITPAELERIARALSLRPRATNNSVCTTHDRIIQFASIESLDKAGVDIAVVGQRPIVEAISANGEIVYDETHSAHLASRVAGTVWRVEKQVGDSLHKGDVLALIDAAEVGRAKAEFLQAIAGQRLALATAERLRPLAGGAVAQRQVQEAEAALQQAQIRLLGAQQALVNLGLAVHADQFEGASTEDIANRIQFLGLPADTIASFDGDSPTSNLYPVRSPLEGLVVARTIVPGEVVDTSATLFRVADVRQMWLMLHVRPDDTRYLRLGQTVLFRPSESPQVEEVKGSLDWISTETDDQTRTVQVRVNLPNHDGRLRANMFGSGRIVLREEPRAIVVPSEAVHSDGCCSVAFVRDKDFFKPGAYKFFHIRKVRLGVHENGMSEIIAGLLPGEVIASKNSVVLEAQLLKSKLGAGCGCGHD